LHRSHIVFEQINHGLVVILCLWQPSTTSSLSAVFSNCADLFPPTAGGRHSRYSTAPDSVWKGPAALRIAIKAEFDGVLVIFPLVQEWMVFRSDPTYPL
jgi:hypothetical protein